MMYDMFQRMKQLLRAYIRWMQRVVVTVALFTMYLAGIGVTAVMVRVGLGPRRKDGWQTAEGYGGDMNDCLRES
jgi:hypothetical protein